MRIALDCEWQLIPISSGTIDNCSTRPIEISDDDGDDDSIIIYPKQRYQFKQLRLKARCGAGKATISVVDFTSTDDDSNAPVATQSDIDSLF